MSLEVEGLVIEIDGRRVVDGVSFAVPDGARLGLIGESGSGKSLTALAILGLLPEGATASGSIRWAGRELIGLPDRQLARLRGDEIGIVFQDFQLLTDRNVHDNLKFVLKATGWKDEDLMDEKIADVLDKVNLKTKGFKFPFELSGGEQQRVDIARALLNSPKLILADEPTGNLDPETSDEIMQLLFQICRDYETSILMATHDYIVINKFPARTIKTERGKLWDNASISLQ